MPRKMSAIKRDLRGWLARLEIRASTSHWADRHAAHHRKTRRAVVEICEAIRKQLLLIGLDPELAVSLRRGEAAEAELAAIPDSEALRAADEAITRGDQNDDGEALGMPMAQIEGMAKHFCDGSQPDLANASLAQLFAFCFAIDETP
jgi:hypothetical protein